jgi:hypothetical protein
VTIETFLIIAFIDHLQVVIEVKVKISLLQAMEAHRVARG